MQLGFKKSLSEPTLYIIGDELNFVNVSSYVDDLLVTGSNKELVRKFKEEMAYFLEMEIKQKNGEVFICQKKYAEEILKRFRVDEGKSVDTPMCQKEKLSKEDEAEKVDETFYKSLVGCLMYLTATKPDILHSVSLLSRFTTCAIEITATKRVLRYVRGTLDYGIRSCANQDCVLQGYSDSD